MPTGDPRGKRKGGPNALPSWRLLAIAGLLCFALLGSFLGWFQICSDSLAADGTVVPLCRPPVATDLAVLVGLTVLLALVWDQLSEMGIPGLFTLKRRIDQAESMIRITHEETEKQARKQEQLETQMALTVMRFEQSLLSTATASSNASIGDVYILNESSLSKMAEDLPEKASAGRRKNHPPNVTAPAEVSPERAILVSRLLSAWAQIQAWLEPPAAGIEGMELTPLEYEEATDRRHRFLALFREELQAVRAARNTAAHSRPISDEALEEALKIAHELLRILRAGNIP